MTRVFVDLDGVLADFDTGYERAFGVRPDKAADNVDWEAVRREPGFYARLPPMPDMLELWAAIVWLVPQPVILTGIPKGVPEAADNKRAWVARHLGPHIEVRCCLSREKCLHAWTGDVLIDDWEKYKHLWLERGGRWITHTSARSTIEQLRGMGVLP